MGVILDESAIEVTEAQEGLNFSLRNRLGPG
jgi:hypothetical protein